ncbi:Ubiquinone/menaquinone biosynthesis C-methylase UbiE, partial [Mycobacterium rhizamassiliense]|jgi:ubiquinone/menaquinone biosynthesis C-methylase UbiE
VPDVSRVWQRPFFVRTVGSSYEWAMQRPRVAAGFGRVVMGADVGRIYRAMAVVAEMPDGTDILDVPCGGGAVISRIRPGQRVRYVGVDVSAAMLDRARARYGDVELVKASIDRMPFADNEFDLCLCFNGLHCVPDPGAAVAEMARCLRPGGRLLGEFAVRGQLARSDAYMSVLRAAGAFGPAGTIRDARRWFTEAGLALDALDCTGAIAHFDARLRE